jgi:hypothetical protein
MDEDFSRQTRRFSAAILTYGKGNRRSMAGKRPAILRAAVVNTGSYIKVGSCFPQEPTPKFRLFYMGVKPLCNFL